MEMPPRSGRATKPVTRRRRLNKTSDNKPMDAAGLPTEVNGYPQGAASAEAADALNRLQRIKSLANEIVSNSPETLDPHENDICFYCGASLSGIRATHRLTCPWIWLQAELSRELGAPTRVVNVAEEACDLYIGLPVRNRPDLGACGWGNPHRVGRDGTRAEVIHWYAHDLLSRLDLLDQLPRLQGLRLGCWCKRRDRVVACHGDVLASVVERMMMTGQSAHQAVEAEVEALQASLPHDGRKEE